MESEKDRHQGCFLPYGCSLLMQNMLTLLLINWMAGIDFAGTVVDLGPGVTSFAIGDKVSCYADARVRK